MRWKKTPPIFRKVFKKESALVDAFENQPQATFEQDWGERHWFRMDYMFLSKVLHEKIVDRNGGLNKFPTALAVSDHAPLVVDLDILDLQKQK